MKKQICILTKSVKLGGYSVAGIDVLSGQWIRLVSDKNPNKDAIKKEQTVLPDKEIECFDVIEYDLIEKTPILCETENYLVNAEVEPKFIKTLSVNDLPDLIGIDADESFVFNKNVLLGYDEVSGLNRSIFAYCVQNLRVKAVPCERRGETSYRYKCSFTYNDYIYADFSLTDPKLRDPVKNGLTFNDALVIVSLPCIPFKDRFYKFIANVIPIDERLAASLKRESAGGGIDKPNDSSANKNPALSPFVKHDLAVQAKQTPGIVLFENYEQLKQTVLKGVAYYDGFEYSLTDYQTALKHRDELKYVKDYLEKTKREIAKNYNSPLEIIEERLDELINAIKIPFKKVDAFIKDNAKSVKKQEIYAFAKNLAAAKGLGRYADNILDSPAFFEAKWLNASCSTAAWRKSVLAKLERASQDIGKIIYDYNDLTPSILANYYQTLSMDKVYDFVKSLNKISGNKISGAAETAYACAESANADSMRAASGLTPSEFATNESAPRFTASRAKNDAPFSDYEVVAHVANSVNPYTGECLTGIDGELKTNC